MSKLQRTHLPRADVVAALKGHTGGAAILVPAVWRRLRQFTAELEAADQAVATPAAAGLAPIRHRVSSTGGLAGQVSLGPSFACRACSRQRVREGGLGRGATPILKDAEASH